MRDITPLVHILKTAGAHMASWHEAGMQSTITGLRKNTEVAQGFLTKKYRWYKLKSAL